MKTPVIKLTMVVAFAVLLSSRPGFADDIASEVQVLRPVDLTILSVMKPIKKKRTEETDVRDDIKERQDQEQR